MTELTTVPHRRLLGNLPELKRDFFGTLTQYHQSYGDAVRFYVGKKPFYLFGHSRFAQEILVKQKEVFTKPYRLDKPRGLVLVLGKGLVTSSGSLWQEQRRAIQPLFYKSKIHDLGVQMIAQGQQLTQQLKQESIKGTVLIDEWLSQCTLAIILQTVFGQEGSEQVHSGIPQDMATLLSFCQRNLFHPAPLPLWIPTKQNRGFLSARKRIRSTMAQMIDRFRQTPERHKDTNLLSILHSVSSPEQKEKFFEDLLIDQCLTLYTAGHETVATALTWVIYLLAEHPEIAQRLQSEVDSVLGTNTPSPEVFDQLPYTRAVLEEAMRLYPPAVLLARRANQDTIVQGVSIPENSICLINLHRLHTNPAIWHNPNQCQPERFLPDQREHIEHFSYLPFGAGPRVCLGSHFALLEGTLLLALLAQSLNFTRDNATAVQPQLAVTLKPTNGLRVKITLRDNHLHKPPPSKSKPSLSIVQTE